MPNAQDIYAGILKPGPQGGIYEPGPPVMLPPQGFGGFPFGQSDTQSEQRQAIAKALLASSGGQGLPSSMAQWPSNWVRDSYPQDMAYPQDMPGPSGYTVADKNQEQLQPSNPANAFAYGEGSPTAPGQQAIAQALMGQDRWGWGQMGGGMNWENMVPSGAGGNDPWSDARLQGQDQSMPGAVTASPIVDRNPPHVFYKDGQKLEIGSDGTVYAFRPDGTRFVTGNSNNITVNGGNPGLNGVGKVNYSGNSKPAISAYQQALATAAQKHGTTPEAIHAQLMKQQSPNSKGQGALKESGMLNSFGMITGGGP